jgi:putative toxin-antitoxin system antitoxin component (TIGR02293 family)
MVFHPGKPPTQAGAAPKTGKAVAVQKRDRAVLQLRGSATTGYSKAPLRRKAWSTADSIIGGKEVLGRSLPTPLDAHKAIEDGLPNRAMHALIDSLHEVEPSLVVEKALGISTRTFQRSREHPNKKMSTEQSSRLWATAELFEGALRVFGDQAAVEHWLVEPAIGLDGKRPIDLVATSAGAAVVKTFLHRIEYGVYT